jgi:DNA-binding transcriptional regulator YiaG
MPNIAKILKEEISRVARREVRSQLEGTRKSVAQHQREIASLKARVKALERKAAALEKTTARPEATPAVEPAVKQARFVAKGLVSMRKRLALSAADLARLMGVSAQTIYNWEAGTTRPRAEQQAKLASLRGVGKRAIRAHMDARQTQPD